LPYGKDLAIDLRARLNALSDVVNKRPRPWQDFDQIFRRQLTGCCKRSTSDASSSGNTSLAVVLSYDLKTLWVLHNQGDSLTPIDPSTGRKGETVHVDDP
jgi:hypothetical protein